MRIESNVLLVEDEASIMQTHCKILCNSGYTLLKAGTVQEARGRFNERFIDLVILDDRLSDSPGDLTGRELLKEFRQQDPDIAAIFVSAHSDAETLMDVIQIGACDYVVKGGGDFPSRLRFAVERALDISARQRQWRWMKTQLSLPNDDSALIGQSETIKKIRDLVRRVAVHDKSDVIIIGETGTGKEVVASEIHRCSPRATKLFLACNVSSLPSMTIESELFGTVKGAYTDAVDRAGLFEAANDGTLFLDEIGDLPKECQPKLLRVLETREFSRLGSTKVQRTSTRVVAATNADLKNAIKLGDFREDLYQRFAIRIQLPPLRDRPEDLGLLVTKLLQSVSLKLGRPLPTISNELLNKLRSYPWPGNVRELRNTLERAMIMSGDAEIDPEYLEFDGDQARVVDNFNDLCTMPFETARLTFERAYWNGILKQCNGNRSEAARIAGINRSRLYDHLKACGIQIRE